MALSALTEEQRKFYVAHDGILCPFCEMDSGEGGGDLEGTGLVETDAGNAWQPIRCNNCKNEWHDIYRLVDAEGQTWEDVTPETVNTGLPGSTTL